MTGIRNARPITASPTRENLAVARALGLEGRLGAWRGISGRRYIVSTISLDRLQDIGSAVFIAVRRDATGRSHVSAVVSGEGADAVADPRFHAADAVDVHLLAETDAARGRMVADLPVTDGHDDAAPRMTPSAPSGTPRAPR